MDESLSQSSHRHLELLCRQQAKLSATAEMRNELERMALEYKRLADLKERQGPGPDEQRAIHAQEGPST